MLDNLVESQNNKNNTKRGGFMLTTSVLVFSLFASGILWSLFARDLGIGGENLDISSMVAPVITEVEPPKPEPVEPKENKQNQSDKVESELPIRRENMASTSEPIAPKEISATPNSVKSRPNTPFLVGKDDFDPKSSSGSSERGVDRSNNSGTGIVKTQPTKIDNETEEPPPTIAKKKEEVKTEPKIEKRNVSGGVLNGKAEFLPKPAYPAPAKAVRASGDVNVQVTIDEKGNVISANAVTGHALLRQAAENAARGAKFTPTYLSNQPVKVTGIIVYKFAMQ